MGGRRGREKGRKRAEKGRNKKRAATTVPRGYLCPRAHQNLQPALTEGQIDGAPQSLKAAPAPSLSLGCHPLARRTQKLLGTAEAPERRGRRWELLRCLLFRPRPLPPPRLLSHRSKTQHGFRPRTRLGRGGEGEKSCLFGATLPSC